ncbi:MAG: hypothetical protein WCA85_12860 [Paraburkholderia sp.]|uniref:hypothetical protein n=1 Tax=Paraburkholderia sp. TaxID=1926495 RepID=UPI003C4B8B13
MDRDELIKDWLASPLIEGVRSSVVTSAGVSNVKGHRLATGKTASITPKTRVGLLRAAQIRKGDLLKELSMIDAILERN